MWLEKPESLLVKEQDCNRTAGLPYQTHDQLQNLPRCPSSSSHCEGIRRIISKVYLCRYWILSDTMCIMGGDLSAARISILKSISDIRGLVRTSLSVLCLSHAVVRSMYIWANTWLLCFLSGTRVHWASMGRCKLLHQTTNKDAVHLAVFPSVNRYRECPWFCYCLYDPGQEKRLVLRSPINWNEWSAYLPDLHGLS